MCTAAASAAKGGKKSEGGGPYNSTYVCTYGERRAHIFRGKEEGESYTAAAAGSAWSNFCTGKEGEGERKEEKGDLWLPREILGDSGGREEFEMLMPPSLMLITFLALFGNAGRNFFYL